MHKTLLILLCGLLAFSGCEKNTDLTTNPDTVTELYFPPTDSEEWADTDPASLNWNEAEIEDLYQFLEDNGTRGFLVLKHGKIVVEKYWGENILDTAPFTRQSNWYWASAGKTLTATLVGIAQSEGLLDIQDPTSDYLGTGWTSATPEREMRITVRNQLTMTTGLEYRATNLSCRTPDCLTYRQDAGTQWYYHNAPYTLLKNVVEAAAGTTYQQFTDQRLANRIGMNGFWLDNGTNNVYWSSPRDMARFGLLMLNGGSWDSTPILEDSGYFTEMTTTSQDLNPAYGYLWWLNGKERVVFPGLSTSFNRQLAPNAPADLIAAMGKDGQFIDVVPSRQLVVIRVGEAPGEELVPVAFHDEIWKRLSTIVN